MSHQAVGAQREIQFADAQHGSGIGLVKRALGFLPPIAIEDRTTKYKNKRRADKDQRAKEPNRISRQFSQRHAPLNLWRRNLVLWGMNGAGVVVRRPGFPTGFACLHLRLAKFLGLVSSQIRRWRISRAAELFSRCLKFILLDDVIDP